MWKKCILLCLTKHSSHLSERKKNPNTYLICNNMKLRMTILQREGVCVHVFAVCICTKTYTKLKSGRTRDQVVVVWRRWRYFSDCSCFEVRLIRKKKTHTQKKKYFHKTFSSLFLSCLHSVRVSHLLSYQTEASRSGPELQARLEHSRLLSLLLLRAFSSHPDIGVTWCPLMVFGSEGTRGELLWVLVNQCLTWLTDALRWSDAASRFCLLRTLKAFLHHLRHQLNTLL